MGYGTCFRCEQWNWLEDHHIFGGPNRKKSEKYKLKVKLCVQCHREGEEAAHKCAKTSQELHEFGQRKYMIERKATIEDFRREFGKNYLLNEEDKNG